jgi:PAS domain S-box-containing protein
MPKCLYSTLPDDDQIGIRASVSDSGPRSWYGAMRAPDELATDVNNREMTRLIDSNVIGAAIGDAKGNVLVANDAVLDMLGFSREDLCQKRLDWLAITPPEWMPKIAEIMAQIRAGAPSVSYETECFHKDGHRVPIAINVMRVRGTEMMLCTIVDLSLPANTRLIDPRTAYYTARKRFGLTDREHEILAFLLEGVTDGEMAVVLGIGRATVSEHVQSIMHKVAVQKRGQLFKRVILE